MWILHIRILWIFPIKNVMSFLLKNLIFVESFEVEVRTFEVWSGEKNTGNYSPEMTSAWGRLYTAVSDFT